MKIYVAGSFLDQKTLRAEADRLWALGHEITGTWLQETTRPSCISPEEFKRKLAIKDLTEVAKADLLILDNRQSSGGKNCEWGVATQQYQHKLLWLIGEPSNVFHYLADRQFRDWDECISFLEFNQKKGDLQYNAMV